MCEKDEIIIVQNMGDGSYLNRHISFSHHPSKHLCFVEIKFARKERNYCQASRLALWHLCCKTSLLAFVAALLGLTLATFETFQKAGLEEWQWYPDFRTNRRFNFKCLTYRTLTLQNTCCSAVLLSRSALEMLIYSFLIVF